MNVSQSNEQFVSLNPTTFAIEYRSRDSGKLTESIPLRPGITPMQNPWQLTVDLLWVGQPNESIYFDLKSKKWIPPLSEYCRIEESSPDDRHWVMRNYTQTDGGIAFIIDRESNEIVSTIEDFAQVHFLDNETMLSLSRRWGTTINKIRVSDGETIDSHSPYWWVLPLLIAGVVPYFIWSYVFLRDTLPEHRGSMGVWLMIAIVAGLPLLTFILRMKVGESMDLGRHPVQYAQAIILSLLLISTLWITNSKQRIVIRLIPMFATLAILFGSVTLLFANDFNGVMIGVLQAIIPESIYVFAFVVARRFGYRIIEPKTAQNSEENSSELATKTSRVTILDMFLLITGAALLLTAITPLLPSFGNSLGQLQHIFSSLASLIVIGLLQVAAWCLAMSGTRGNAKNGKRTIKPITIIVFTILLFLLVFEPAYQFATGKNHITNWLSLVLHQQDPVIPRILVCSFLTTFWLGLTFRFSGWRWERIDSKTITSV